MPFQVPTVEADNVSVEDIVNFLTQHGGGVIKSLIDQDTLSNVFDEVSPHFNKFWDGSLFSNKTRVLYSDICDRLLTSTHTCWYGDEVHIFTSGPQINSTSAFSTFPGNTPQKLHRDDMGHHNKLPAISPDQYDVGRETAIVLFVAGSRTTKENGATRFIPGSHLWDTMTPPDESMTVHAEMQPGDGFIMLASCYHAASENKTLDEERVAYSTFTTKGILRQEENECLSIPLKELRKMSPRMQKRFGFAASDPMHGWVGLKDPIEALGLPGDSGCEQLRN